MTEKGVSLKGLNQGNMVGVAEHTNWTLYFHVLSRMRGFSCWIIALYNRSGLLRWIPCLSLFICSTLIQHLVLKIFLSIHSTNVSGSHGSFLNFIKMKEKIQNILIHRITIGTKKAKILFQEIIRWTSEKNEQIYITTW